MTVLLDIHADIMADRKYEVVNLGQKYFDLDRV